VEKKVLVKAVFLLVLLLSALVGARAVNLGFAQDDEIEDFKIVIEADGSVNPSTALISQVGNVYIMTGDISGKVEIEKSNVVFDGAGYSLIAPPDSWALSIGWMSFIDSVITNVTVKNVNIIPDPSAPELSWGILLESTNSVIANCTISNMPDVYGIGIWVQGSGNVIVGNNLTGIHRTAINIDASNNIIVGNIITSCGNAVYFSSASNNTVTGNHIENNGVGVHGWSGNPLPPDLRNFIYYNDFVNNTRDFLNEAIYISDIHVLLYPALVNIWDNGTVGNYWSGYNGTDANGDGIGDTPYFIDANYPLEDANDTDHFPLMKPIGNPIIADSNPPKLSIISPENRTYATSTVLLTVNVDKPALWMEYSLDNQGCVSFSGNTTLTGLADGTHNLTISAASLAGNQNSSSVIFTVDTASPVISILCPENCSYQSTDNLLDVALTFTVNEPVFQFAYSLDGQANVTVAGNITLTGLTAGVHNVTVYAWDIAENVGVSETVTFSVAEPEPFPVVPVASFAVAVAVAGAGFLLYFKKHNHKVEKNVALAKSSALFFSVLLLFSVVAGAGSVSLVSGNGFPAPPISHIYIYSNGTFAPSTAPIMRDGDVYTLKRSLTNYSIIVKRDNIVIDGAENEIKGNGADDGIIISYRTHITIKDMKITDFGYGVRADYSSNNSILRNTMTSTFTGVSLLYSDYNQIIGNEVTNGYGVSGSGSNNFILGNTFTSGLSGGGNGMGVYLSGNNNTISYNTLRHELSMNIGSSQYNTISNNTIIGGREGLLIAASSNNLIFGNIIKVTSGPKSSGLKLSSDSFGNIVFANHFENNDLAVALGYESDSGALLWNNVYDNRFHHNNFVSNTQDVWIAPGAPVNFWDDGDEGNYCSHYNGTDADGNGIGDTPWVLADNNQDNYPLMTPLEIKNTTPDLFPSPTSSSTPTPSPTPNSTATPTSPSPTISPSPTLNPESDSAPELPLLIILTSLVTATLVGWLFYKTKHP
jgi:parallel beta-helix repeat protein